LLFSLIVFALQVISQHIPKILQTTNEEIKSITESITENGWLYLKSGQFPTADKIFTSHKSAFGLTQNDEMREYKTKTEKSGWKTVRYRQYFNNIPVEGATYSIHMRNGSAYLAHGNIVEGLNISTVPNINEQDALIVALSALGAQKYAWEDDAWENGLKTDLNDNRETYYPTGELVLVRKPEKIYLINQDMVLAYRFDISSLDPFDHREVYINAHSGELVKNQTLIISCFSNESKVFSTGTLNSIYNGTRTFTTKTQRLS